MAEGKKNYKKYIKNEEPLKYAVLPFDEEGDAIYNFISKNMRRDLWVVPFKAMHNWQSNIKKDKTK